MNTDDYLRINEIKNYLYCPRIPFYLLCMGMDRDTALARIGVEQEAIAKKRMKRRQHALHAVHDGTRHFDVPVLHHDLRLIGRVDEVVETEAGVYLVDYKDTDQNHGYWRVQMTAYRLCMEAARVTVLGCYIYTIPEQAYKPVKSTPKDEAKLVEIIGALHEIIASEFCPPPTPHIRKCHTCQYVRFCNDVH